jgi:hypothetical protein
MRSLLVLALASLFSIALAQSGDVTCGDNVYTPDEITAAINAGLQDLDDGNLQGYSYPIYMQSLD